MVSILLVLAVVVLVIAVGLGQTAPTHRRPPAEPPPTDELSPAELSLEDPLEALRRYGTPQDAARLAEQGVDLAALGYRPPDR